MNKLLLAWSKLKVFVNTPFGLWLLSSVGIGLLGFSYDVYKSEKSLSLERLQILAEVRHRINVAEREIGIPHLSCSDAVKYFNADDMDRELAEKYYQFFIRVFQNHNHDFLFSQYSSESTLAIIHYYEINIARSQLLMGLERSGMEIVDLHKDLAFLGALIGFEKNKTQQSHNKINSMTMLYAYKNLIDYFQYQYAMHYLNGQVNDEQLDCRHRMQSSA